MSAQPKYQPVFHNLYEFEEDYKSTLPTETLRNIWERNADRSDLIKAGTEIGAAVLFCGLAGNAVGEGVRVGNLKELFLAAGSFIGGEALLFRGFRFCHKGLFSKQFDDDGDLSHFAQGNRFVDRRARKEAHLVVTLNNLAERLTKPGSSAAVPARPAIEECIGVDESDLFSLEL